MTNTREIQRRAWERGASSGNFAVAYEGVNHDYDGTVLAPDGILSGEWSGESIPELVPEADEISDYRVVDDLYDLYESAYSDGFVALASWAESDEDNDAPANPYDIP